MTDHGILTLYALSAPPVQNVPPDAVDQDTLLEAMKGRILTTASLNVTHDRTALTVSR